MSDWKELDLTLFNDCAGQMGYSDYLFTEDFETKRAMNSLEVGRIKLDSHMHQKGQYTVDEYLANVAVPDENITSEEIIAICSRFADFQANRFEGYNILTNVLTCVYLQKGFEIKNPVLKFVFKCFNHCIHSVEKFVNTIGLFNIPSWLISLKYDEYFNEDCTDDELQEEYKNISLPEEIKSLIEFEMKFAKFIQDPFHNEIEFDVTIPDKITNVGFAPYLHYRDLSPSNPVPKPSNPDHAATQGIFSKLIDECKDVKQQITECKLDEVLVKLAMWNESSEHVALSRFVALSMVLPLDSNDMTFFGIPFKTYLRNDLIAFNIPTMFFDYKEFPEFADTTYKSLTFICRFFIMPTPTAHSRLILNGAQYWGYIQTQGFEIYRTAVPAKHVPKCQNLDHSRAASMLFPLWSTQIGSIILYYIYRWGFKNGVYSERDLGIELHLLELATKTETLALLQHRIAEAVFKSKTQKKKAVHLVKVQDVNKYQQSASAKEVFNEILSEYYSACFQTWRLITFWKNIDVKYGPYFSEEPLYNLRKQPANSMMHFQVLEYNEYSKIFNNEKDIEFIKKSTTIRFTNARSLLAKYLKMDGAIKSPENSLLMRSIVSNSIFISKLTQESKAKVDFQTHYAFPIFSVL